MNAYHYTESGLDNVYIMGVPIEVDDGGESTVTIASINQLHKVIALGIVNHEHGMNGAELRFIRTEMGLSQAQLAKIVHRDGQTIGRWERGEIEIDETAETIIRLLAIERLELKTAARVDEISSRAGSTLQVNKIEIEASMHGKKVQYHLLAA